MKVLDTNLFDVKLIKQFVFHDNRGLFMESFRDKEFEPRKWVQDNVSISKEGVIRGLHYQLVQPQAKLVTVMAGKILDVAVDIRKGSPTFGMYVDRVLEAESGEQLFIPEGFAHGFQALEDNTVVHYKCSDYYCFDGSRGIRFDDPAIGIKWWWLEGAVTTISEKDETYPLLCDAEKPIFNEFCRF
jgi:dTDP-4-dehydrorhamnose 3,5-epimerase